MLYFGHDQWRDLIRGLTMLRDAVNLRMRSFGPFEQAERPNRALRDGVTRPSGR
jgi:hypothetical protein